MAKSAPQLEWCIVRLGEDLNWWVNEISDDIRWDVDGLSIIDPRQISHIIDLIEPLREYGFDPDLMDMAFIPFRIDKELSEGRVRLARIKESVFEAEEKLFALPDVTDDENGPYADFIDHITRMRVKMLNDLFDFEQKLTVDEVEDELREEQNNSFIEGSSVHLYNEIVSILDYVPAGWEIDEDDDSKGEEDEDEFPDIEEEQSDDEEERKLKEDESLRWDEDEEEDDFDDEFSEEGDDDKDEEDDDDDENLDADEDEDDLDDEAPKRRRRR